MERSEARRGCPGAKGEGWALAPVACNVPATCPSPPGAPDRRSLNDRLRGGGGGAESFCRAAAEVLPGAPHLALKDSDGPHRPSPLFRADAGLRGPGAQTFAAL